MERPDGPLAGWMTLAAGVGATWGGLAAVRGDVLHTALGGGVAGAALLVLTGAGWLDGLVLVALSIPLPALLSTDDLRLAAAAPVTALAVTAWGMEWAVRPRKVVTRPLPLRSLALLGGALLLATLFARSPVLSARELLNLGVLLLLLVVATDVFSRRRDRARTVARLLVVLGALCGALALLQALGVIPGRFPNRSGPLNRAALGFGQPNGLALFLAVLVPLGVHFASRSEGRLRRAWAMGVVAILVGLVATFSRGSWIALAAGSGVLLLGGEWRTVARMGVYGFLFLAVADVALGGAVSGALLALTDDWVVEQRLALVLGGVLVFLENPVLGVGPGGFALEIDRVAAVLPDLWDLRRTPHNAYVQMAAEAGIVGLLAYLLLLAVILRTLVVRVRRAGSGDPEERSYRRALLWSFGVVLVAGLFGWPFPHGVGQCVILVTALGLAESPP